ncbi:hypothetical protein JOE44_000371 [Chryseobacterium sp. PvR013]|uniref:reverse transcriptase domain-containing protein n=1 Tax=Chryseobacterium sp. PvR013 TaxID=2806595 RepID=UPI001AEA00B1|nr:reverse transcriptase domain-containing protein [Chryseobacterium sp. PvR013]MBP1163487.1 hypothetical protein [Chryseobacterium sp. PvR013]
MNKYISSEDKVKIKEKFEKMSDLKEFCNLLNHCYSILFSDESNFIDEEKLKRFANQNSQNRYHYFEIKKKDGSTRIIHAPSSELKVLLKCLNLIFHSIFIPHHASYGFIYGRSILDNAKIHCKNNYVFNLDLQDFFSSIEIGRILKRFNYPPFSLNKDNGREIIGNYIGWIACEEIDLEEEVNGKLLKIKKKVLPQGSPLSPILTNIICERLDYKLTGVAKRFNVTYSRYADDITFSSMHNVYQEKSIFRNEVEKIIGEQYFRIKEKKTRLQKRNVRQKVTGIVVNEKVNVTKNYIKLIRLWLSMWEKYGAEKAYHLFINSYIKEKGFTKYIGSTPVFMENVIDGKLNYLKMIKGESNSTYQSLRERFNRLSIKNAKMNKILDLWEFESIEKAIEYYYR